MIRALCIVFAMSALLPACAYKGSLKMPSQIAVQEEKARAKAERDAERRQTQENKVPEAE